MIRALPLLGLLLLWGCDPECFDLNDCRGRTPAGQVARCEQGRCVFSPREDEPPIDPRVYGDLPDAGDTADAGDGSDGDAGGGGGSAGGAGGGGGSAGGAGGGGGSAGGAGGGGGRDGGTDAGTAADGGLFIIKLYNAPLLAPGSDGGGIRGSGSLSAVSIGGGQWQLRYSMGHDAGSVVLRAELRNSVAPLTGPLLGAGTLSSSGLSPVAGTLDLTAAALKEVQDGRAYVAFPSVDVSDGYLRGQIVQPGEDLGANELKPLAGFPHPGSGGGQLLLKISALTARYESRWTSDVAATASHLHLPDGGLVFSFALTPDGGGTRGALSLLNIYACASQPCYQDVHTADGGADGGVLLRTPP